MGTKEKIFAKKLYLAGGNLIAQEVELLKRPQLHLLERKDISVFVSIIEFISEYSHSESTYIKRSHLQQPKEAISELAFASFSKLVLVIILSYEN